MSGEKKAEERTVMPADNHADNGKNLRGHCYRFGNFIECKAGKDRAKIRAAHISPPDC